MCVAWWPKLKADSYGSMYGQQMEAAEEKNGTSPTPSGDLPALTNDDALCLVEYWQREARRNHTSWPGWYPIALLALGYRKKGDKFKLDKKHAHSWLPSDGLPLVWETELLPFSARLDDEQTATPVKPRAFNPSKNWYARFVRVARAAWERLRREREKVPLPPRPGHGLPSRRTIEIVLMVIAGVWVWKNFLKD